MIKFDTLQEAFEWAFDEKEDMQQLKIDLGLNDEFETVKDVTSMIGSNRLEIYLLKHSYLVPYEDGYIFYEQEDYEDNDELIFELSGLLGENEG